MPGCSVMQSAGIESLLDGPKAKVLGLGHPLPGPITWRNALHRVGSSLDMFDNAW